MIELKKSGKARVVRLLEGVRSEQLSSTDWYHAGAEKQFEYHLDYRLWFHCLSVQFSFFQKKHHFPVPAAPSLLSISR